MREQFSEWLSGAEEVGWREVLVSVLWGDFVLFPEPMISLDLSLLANDMNWVVYFPFWQLSVPDCPGGSILLSFLDGEHPFCACPGLVPLA